MIIVKYLFDVKVYGYVRRNWIRGKSNINKKGGILGQKLCMNKTEDTQAAVDINLGEKMDIKCDGGVSLACPNPDAILHITVPSITKL